MPGERRRSGLLSLVPFAAGLVLGVGMGMPAAHFLVQLVSQPVAAAPTSEPSAGSTPAASPTPHPAGVSPTPSTAPSRGALPTASAPLCSALVPGQPSLDPLQPPPTGYRVDATLGWLGCGTTRLLAAEGGAVLHLDEPWLIAISYSCPMGTAAISPTATLSVLESAAPPRTLGSESGDAGRAIVGAAGGAPFSAGVAQLEVRAPAACLWHVALYPAQP